MRQVIAFDCAGDTLFGTLDDGTARAGLLIVSGGREVRTGAHRGMAELAQDIAGHGFPVFRFDRRGVGDSSGADNGFAASRPDIVAALAQFRRECPSLSRIVAFGNCDGATALWLHQPLAVDALVLANPWLVEITNEAPSPVSTRAYYARRLRDPKAWKQLLSGAVDIRKLIGGVQTAAKREPVSSLAQRVAVQIAENPLPTKIILAADDGTAVAFKAQWNGPLFDGLRADVPVTMLTSASHSFASDADHQALVGVLLEALAG